MIVARRKAVERTFEATCLNTDAVGDLVYISAANKTIRKANVFDWLRMPAIGVIIAKPTATTASVQMAGVVKNTYTGLTPGRLYFVGTDSRPSLVLPSGPQKRWVQPIGTALDTNELFLLPGTHLTAIRD